MSRYTKVHGDKDLLVLSHLRQDARIKLTDLSKKVRVPVSTLFDMIRSFESHGVIRKHVSLVRFEDFGYRSKALIALSTHKSKRAKLLEVLEQCDHVNSLYKINNGWDFLAEVIFLGMKEVEDFIADIEEKVKLKGKKVFYIIDELKKEEFLSNPQKEQILRRLP